jgi:hypothetical protein
VYILDRTERPIEPQHFDPEHEWLAKESNALYESCSQYYGKWWCHFQRLEQTLSDGSVLDLSGEKRKCLDGDNAAPVTMELLYATLLIYILPFHSSILTSLSQSKEAHPLITSHPKSVVL